MIQDDTSARNGLALAARQTENRFIGILKQLLKVRLAGMGMGVIIFFIALAVFADWIAPYQPNKQNAYAILKAPSLEHPFGTDHLGRDIISRVVYGARVSLTVGIIAMGIALAIGIPLGLLSGYYRGLVDDVIMRVTDAMIAFPWLVLALGITAALGPGLNNVMIAIGIVFWAGFARLIRGQVLAVREFDYVSAARAVGARDLRILFIHVWPNVTAPIIVQASLGIAYTVLAEASLSFLGMGVQPPTPTWGSMLREGTTYLTVSPWLGIFPGVAIMLLVLAFNFLGDGLRDVLDPRLGRTLRMR